MGPLVTAGVANVGAKAAHPVGLTSLLPRQQSGSAPQHLLVTLLGDYWLDPAAQVPTAAVVDVLAEFDVSAVNARTALSRLSRRGLVATERSGRHAHLRLSADARRDLSSGAARIMRFGLPAGPWDGLWTLVTFSLPEEQRNVRHRLRSTLRWLGFAVLFDGVWVSPGSPLDRLEELFTHLGVESFSVLRVLEPALGRSPLHAWDLSSTQRAYEDFLDAHDRLRDRVRTGSVGSAEALVSRTRVMDAWRALPALDPGLPDELLPADWPRVRARALFTELYDSLGPLSEHRVRQLVQKHDQQLADLATHHTSSAWSAD